MSKNTFPKGLKLPPRRTLKLPVNANRAEWYLIGVDGNEAGPYTCGEIRKLITSNTYVWREGMQEWKRAGNTTLLDVKSNIGNRFSWQTKTISDKWAWWLSAGPISISLIVSFIMYGLNRFDEQVMLWIPISVCVVLNSIFAIIDAKHIEESGNDGPSNILGLFCVPAYLFIRSAKLAKPYAPAFLWCFLCAFDLYWTDQMLLGARAKSVLRTCEEITINGYANEIDKEHIHVPEKTITANTLVGMINSQAGWNNPAVEFETYHEGLLHQLEAMTKTRQTALLEGESGRSVWIKGCVDDVSDEETFSESEPFSDVGYTRVEITGVNGKYEALAFGVQRNKARALSKGELVKIEGRIFFHEVSVGGKAVIQIKSIGFP